jgi:hypothetical protein
MFSLLVSAFTVLCSSFRTRAALQLEILALRHQINVLRRSRSPDGPEIAVAEPVCGAIGRIDPTGVSGPHRRVQPIVFVTHTQIVLQLLPRGANAPVAGERCTGDQADSTAGIGVSH